MWTERKQCPWCMSTLTVAQAVPADGNDASKDKVGDEVIVNRQHRHVAFPSQRQGVLLAVFWEMLDPGPNCRFRVNILGSFQP